MPLAVLLTQLAPGIRSEQIARIEPVRGYRVSEDGRKVAGEVRDVRAAPMPERPAIGDALESEHLFHAAVAVRGHDENAVGDAHDDVVVEFSLRPMVDELVPSVTRA